MPVSVVQLFIRAVNAHDIGAMADCLSADHVFVDAYGEEVAGEHAAVSAWEQYFAIFPDYHIEIEEIYGNGGSVAVFGFASGASAGNPQSHWKIPAAWKAQVREDKIARWQVYADTKIPYEIIHRSGQAKENEEDTGGSQRIDEPPRAGQ